METMFKMGAAARRLGGTPKTLQRWDRCGTFSPLARSPTGLHLYSEAQILERIGLQSRPTPQRIIAYCRVSSAAQKPDLRNQRRVLEEFCTARGLANVEFLEEIGGIELQAPWPARSDRCDLPKRGADARAGAPGSADAFWL